MYETEPGTQERIGVAAEDLAKVTAEEAFEEADLDHDGRLSFDEFQRWFMSPTNALGGGGSAASAPAAATSQQSVAEAAVGLSRDAPGHFSITEVRRLTKLDMFEPDEVFEIFGEASAEADQPGALTRAVFRRCFARIVKLGGGHAKGGDYAAVTTVVNRLFDMFDSDGNGIVDFRELSSGLSVLCSGTRDEKVRAAFSLYDYNRDGFISLDEMTKYITSVFKVMFESNPGTREAMGVSAEELGRVTAERAFTDCDANHDGQLSFEEFKQWYATAGMQ